MDVRSRQSLETSVGPRPGESIALVVAYDGAPFAGFQIQPDRDTVQGRLQDALATILGRDVTLTCAGRTDAGVHAVGQVVSFESTGEEPPHDALLRSLNALAGPGITVREIRRARPGFSARHDALSRRYCYRLTPGPVPPLLAGHVSWWVKGALDLEEMRRAAVTLVGEHDFTSFCVAESARLHPTTREILSVDIDTEEILGDACVTVAVHGRSFLHQMVRIMVGSLVEVGRGRRDAAWTADALARRDRSTAGPTAPPHGLVFESVEYPHGVWL